LWVLNQIFCRSVVIYFNKFLADMKKSFTRSLAAAIFIAAGSASAFADGNININSPTSDTTNGWTFSGSRLTITANGAYTITGNGSSTTNYIVVQPSVTADITLSGVSMNMKPDGNTCAFLMSNATVVNLTLEGDNVLKSGAYRAGLEVPSGATLMIDGAGSLVATNSEGGGAGIGGMIGSAGGNITISGGTVTAIAGNHGGAGIGGGGSAGGNINITGGTVTASSSSGGAGIGGGSSNKATGAVTITGGSVKMNNHDGPQPTNGNSKSVYLNTLTVGSPAVSNGTSITAGSINGVSCADTANASANVYGIKDVKTDDSGKVYFYLPESAGNELVKLTANGTEYDESYTRSADHSNAQTLTGPYGIALSKTGTHNFPAAGYGYSSAPAPLTVTIINTGYSATGDLTVAVSGAGLSAFTLSSSATIASIAVDSTSSFTVAPNEGLAAGTYTETVTVSGENNISAPFVVSFTVNKKDVAITDAVVDTKTYDGTAIAIVTGVTFYELENSEFLKFDEDYKVTSAAFTDPNAGSGNRIVQMTVVLENTDKANNYNLTNGTNWQLANQSIVKADLTAAHLKSVTESVNYDGLPHAATIELASPCTGLGIITDTTYSNGGGEDSNTPVNAGGYTVKVNIEGGDNFNAANNLDLSGNFTINKIGW
jgi:hypothetical protein